MMGRRGRGLPQKSASGSEPREGAEPEACTPGQYLSEGSEQPQDGAGVCGGEDGEHGEREPLICFLAALAASFHRCVVTFPCPPALNSPSSPCSARVCSSFLHVLRETCSNASPFSFSPPLAFLPFPRQTQKQFFLFGAPNWGI